MEPLVQLFLVNGFFKRYCFNHESINNAVKIVCTAYKKRYHDLKTPQQLIEYCYDLSKNPATPNVYYYDIMDFFDSYLPYVEYALVPAFMREHYSILESGYKLYLIDNKIHA